MTSAVRTGRQAGILLPLFSCPSSASWGIGEIGDIPAAAAWMRDAGLRLWQFLPVNEMAPGQSSPYSAISAMAIDPIYISLRLLPEFVAGGGEAALDTAMRGALAQVREAPAVNYEGVRTIKDRALRNAFARFLESEWVRDSSRADAFRAFAAEQAWWLADYALFRAIHHLSGGRAWSDWEEGARSRDRSVLARLQSQLAREVLFRQYLQWIAHGQWQAARLRARGVRLFGDLPFMVATDSADVWSRQHQFAFDATVGAPPDAFSATGQNWLLPVPRWDLMRADGYDWFRSRARRAADLFDGFRVDHLVGLFRTWVFPLDGAATPHFVPAGEPAQRTQGRAVLAAIGSTPAQVIAEDLGTIPDFVRATMKEIGLPGFKVLRWQREWKVSGRPFYDPLAYPANSVAASGTHDTETLATWWDALEDDERASLLAIPHLAATLGDVDEARAPFQPALRDALLDLLYASGSDLLILPVQDLFGWTERINVPAVIDGVNWTWRLPWPVDRIDAEPEAAERKAALSGWARKYGRG